MTVPRYWAIAVLTLLIVLGSSGYIDAQRELPDEVRVDASFVDVPIDSALLLLSSLSGVNISYNSAIIPTDERRSYEVKRLELGNILDDVLHDTGLIYKIVANQLVIIKDPKLEVKPFYTVNGWVSREESEERIPFANVFTHDRFVSTQTNEFGYFSISLRQGVNILNFTSFPNDKIISIDIRSDTTLNILLPPDNELQEIFVTDFIPNKSKQAEQFDEVPLEMLGSLSALAGEPDVLRLVQARAGVNTAADGLGGISVRGGNADQNLVLMDGVPVYNTGHALGLFSIFNSGAIKDVKVIKSGFPARYGGRVSSVIDVTLKEGNKQELSGEVNANPLLVSGVLEGPISKGNSSFIVSGRRTIVDPWLRPLSRFSFELDEQVGFVDYRFFDLNAKLNFYIGDKDELYISGYTGGDRFDNEVEGTVTDEVDNVTTTELDVIGWNWGNDILSARWTHHFNRKLVSYFNVGISNYEFESFNFDRIILEPQTELEQIAYSSTFYQSDINDVIINGNIDYFASSKYFLKAGFNITAHSLTPGSTFSSTRDNLLDDDNRLSIETARELNESEEITGLENRLYVENELTFDKLIINAGLHYSFITTDDNSYHSLQPRLAAKFLTGEHSQLKFSYSSLDQFLHLLSSSGFGLPNDIWIPSTDIIAPQRSNELSISYLRELPQFGSLTISGYNRNMTNIRTLIDGGFLAIDLSNNWEQQVPVGRQDAYGIELELEKRVGRLRGFMSYTLSKATNTFQTINEGEPFAARLDRRHSFKINGIYQINQNLEFSASWQYSSGLPFTAPEELVPVEIDDTVTFVPLFSDINNVDLPDLHRLDFAFNLYNEYSWGRQKLSIGAYNAYSRNNPFFIDVARNPVTNTFEAETVSIVPIFPFVSLSLSF